MKATRVPLAWPAVMVTLLIALWGRHGPADAAEITIFASRAMATMLERIGPEFEEATGHTLRVMSGHGPGLVERIHAGESFDIVAAPRPVVDGLVKAAKVIADTRTPLVRSRVGVAVRAGSRKPDLSSVEAFKRALLDARSVGYLPSAGVPQLLHRLGLAPAVQAKAVVPATDTVCELVAQGKVELGVVIVAQILTTPGVELAGRLPQEIQFWIEFAAAVHAHAAEPRAARDLIQFLARSKAHPVIAMQGMEPA